MLYKIRPHHGMCFAFFQRKGYSGEFIENMQVMKEKLEENPEVILVCGPDDVCVHCPNNRNGKCACSSASSHFVNNTAPLFENISQLPSENSSFLQVSENNETRFPCKADYYDRQVLAYCALTVGSKIHWNDFAAAVKTSILTPGNREKICGNCEWNSLCR